MSAIFRKKDFDVFNYVIEANNSDLWREFKIGHGEGVLGWNYNVAVFYLPKHRAQVAVVNGYRGFPKFNFCLDEEKESAISKTYYKAYNAPQESRYNLIIDFLSEQIEEFKNNKKNGD